MRLVKAIAAFLRVWFNTGSCTHARVDVTKGSAYCPDCGYHVKVVWNMLVCRRCSAKRLPKPSIFGPIQPQELFCKHCGYDRVQHVQKDHIQPYELPFAISELYTDFGSQPGGDPHAPAYRPGGTMPAHGYVPYVRQSLYHNRWRMPASVRKAQGTTAMPGQVVGHRQVFHGSRRAYEQHKHHWQPQTHAWHQNGGKDYRASDTYMSVPNPVSTGQAGNPWKAPAQEAPPKQLGTSNNPSLSSASS
ncbi:MAG: zinc ribbon domain-containing protein [Cyanobacteria bacterium HKST-UBA06]|nr:zinc ribbon domain-containing protein [Cyanobacteria bacterium HKST-UBA06]